LLLVFGTSVHANAQSYAKFSVEPSDPALQAGIGVPGTKFTFTADVSDAQSYRIEFGDGDHDERVIQPGADPRAVVSHSYDRPDRYVAKLIARQSSGESIELPLDVRVEPPPSPAQSREKHAAFSVSPSDPDDHDDIVYPWADFTFIADVSNAESYEVDFGDDKVERNIAPGPDGRATVRHSYSEPGEYRAIMNASRDNGDTVEQVVWVSVTVPPEPPSHALFSVLPSDPEIYDDIEFPWADFTFTADVTDATEYELDFDDGEKQLVAPQSDGKAVVRHVYEKDGRYDARMTAQRSSGEAIIRPLSITVSAPDPVSLIPRERNRWPWILLAGVVALLIYTAWKLLTVRTGNHLISFEPRVDTGRVRISGSTAADDPVSMRLRRDPGRVVLSVNDGE
jgi:hypothetical protein